MIVNEVTFWLTPLVFAVFFLVVALLSPEKGEKTFSHGALLGALIVGGFNLIGLYVEPKSAPMYECPCEAQELVSETITHYNKTTGDTTTTTYIDLSRCLIVKDK